MGSHGEECVLLCLIVLVKTIIFRYVCVLWVVCTPFSVCVCACGYMCVESLCWELEGRSCSLDISSARPRVENCSRKVEL